MPPLTQSWLHAIYQSPELYEGKIIAISNDRDIIAIADSYKSANEQALLKQRALDTVSFFSVPYNVRDLRIMTLRLRSLREDLWSPMYDVTLKSAHGELRNCRMLIDSGADISLISKKTGEELGLQRSEEEEALTAQGVGGATQYLLRKIVVVIDNYAIAISVAWCQNEEITDMILGRKDVFDAFNVEFRQKEQKIIFTPVSDEIRMIA
jgi:hypothetical protein